MTLVHTATIRNAMADLVADAVDVGSGTAVLEIRDGTTVLISFNLQNPAFGDAALGISSVLGTPIATTGSGDGNADNFIVRDRDGTEIFNGTVTATGLGGDIEISNIAIANGQNVSLEGSTYEAVG